MFEKIEKIINPDGFRIVTLAIQFEDAGPVNRVEVSINVLNNGENIGSERGNITDIGFEIPDEIMPHILALKQLAEEALKTYKGIKNKKPKKK